MTIDLYSIGTVARQLGVASYRIAYAHEQGKVPEPARRIAGKRAYDENEIAALADFFDVPFLAAEAEEPEGGENEIQL